MLFGSFANMIPVRFLASADEGTVNFLKCRRKIFLSSYVFPIDLIPDSRNDIVFRRASFE